MWLTIKNKNAWKSKQNEIRKEKRMNAEKGVQQCYGVCRNKKVGLQKTCWAWCTGWVGDGGGSVQTWVGPRRTEPVGGVYMGCKPNFPSFCVVFSLSSLPSLKKALFSLLLCSSSLWVFRRGFIRTQIPARQPAMVGGGGAAADHRRWRRRRHKHLFLIFFLWFLLYFLF